MGQIYDVIVAGGGPAGSTAARVAALRGLDVLILEKSIFPRYKPCGGALSLKALSMLDGPLPPQIQERKITGARVHYRDLVLERHKGYEITQLIDRSAFDQHLLERAILAGARAMTEKALGFKDSGEWVSVQTKDEVYKSRFLVVASGCQDALKKEIAGPESKKSMGLCLVTEIEAEEERIVEHLGSALDIHFSVAGGYGWIFPHRGYYSVGIGGLSSSLCYPRQTMRRFLRENGFSQEARLSGHLIPQGGNQRRVARGRVLLAGDAAGLVDPFTGEGIYYSLASGKIAGEMVGDVPAAIVARSYESRIEKELGRELGHALFFSKIMHRHPQLFLRILAQEEQVLERYLEVGAGEMSYRDFMIWLLPRLPLSLMRAGWI